MTNEEKWQHVLEKCGFKALTHAEKYPQISTNRPDDIVGWFDPDGTHHYALPDITLDNLFKWVVPMLPKEWRNWKSVLHDWVEGLTGDREKDTIALLDAIYEAVK